MTSAGLSSSPLDPRERVPISSTQLQVTRLGFGAASIGGLFEAVPEEHALATVERAWEAGIRYFDVAPLYGYGNAERRLGEVLATKPRDDFVISTKVGRLLRSRDATDRDPTAAIDRQMFDGVDDYFYRGVPPVRPVFDYSYDGTLRSVEESLERLRLDRVDILFIHDPDAHWDEAVSGAYPALARLRGEGVVGAIGAGMNQAEMLARFVRETDIDVVLCAGRYTLLDQTALVELLPACLERNVDVVIGGVMNSGILADPRPDSRFNYARADPTMVDRALRIKTLAEGFGVALRAAAIQFVFAHPAVRTLVAGVRTPAHLDDTMAMMQVPIPPAFWERLREEGVLPVAVPTPG